jgi:hypothetical protein
MTVETLAMSKEEVAHRGTEIYQRLQPQIEPMYRESVIAIDVRSGDYEINADAVTASKPLLQRHPDALIWFQRVGYGFLHSMVSFRREE